MVILDFFGMPGSGKSTISHELANMLRKRNYKVVEPIWNLDMRDSTFKRLLSKIIFSLMFSAVNFRLIKEVFSLFNEKSFMSSIEKLKMWINVSYTLHLLNKYHDVDFLIADEGIAQAVISLFTRSSCDKAKECFKLLSDNVAAKTEFIYVEISMDTVLKRLDNRKNGNSRVDRLKGDARKNMLAKIKDICEILAQSNDIIVISNEESLEEFDYSGLINDILNRMVHKK